MAKRKKRASAHKEAPSQRTKARTRGGSARRAGAKRVTKARAKTGAKRVALTKTKKRASKARAIRAAAKKTVPRPTEPSTEPAEARDETVIVDMIEEPFPGVVVVTEFETVRTTRRERPASHPEAEEGFGVAERQGEED